MKKVLILAYDFPPYVSVGGLRPYNWLKYLPEYGVQPIVVTRNWYIEYGSGLDYITASSSDEVVVNREEKGLVIRTPYHPNLSNRLLLKYGANRFRLVRKALTAWNEITQFIWVTGTKKELYYAAEEYLEDNKVDAIIATGDPFVLFDFARKLGKKYNTPWIADYRDPWSGVEGAQKEALLGNLYKFLENKIVQSAAYITTTNDVFGSMIMEAVPSAQKIQYISNGYDPDALFLASDVVQSSDCLTISLAGSLYPWHPWREFLMVVNRYCKENEATIKVKFYGLRNEDEVLSFVQENELCYTIELCPRIANSELLPELAKDNALLLFNDYYHAATKIYDYLAIKRSILFCFTDDEDSRQLKQDHYHVKSDSPVERQKEIILETNAGILVKDQAHLYDVLTTLLQEFQQNGAIACNSVGVEKYSRKIQVKKLAELVKNLK